MAAVDHPLRLAVGSHQAGSGKGCAMNVISWENGDTTITDLPACADVVLAKIVQRVNDETCAHRDGDLLCPSCSVKVLELGHRTVGTGTHPLTDDERRRVWVRVAADQARQVAHLNHDPRVVAAIEAAEGWREVTTTVLSEAKHAAMEARFNPCAASAAWAAWSVTQAFRGEEWTVKAACDAAAWAADAACWLHPDAADRRLALAHRAIDVWCETAGFTPTPTAPETTVDAVRRMLEVAQ